jgi:hypothetical protein
MQAIELIGDIDDQHRLQARVPEGLPGGPVRLIVLLPDEDQSGFAWARGVAKEWAEELQDTSQDIYTLEDGPTGECTRVMSIWAAFHFGDVPGMKLRPV